MRLRLPFLLLAILLLGAGLGVGLGLSEAPVLPNGNAIGVRSASPPPTTAAPAIMATTLPGGQKLPPGAGVTSVVHFQGQEVAAGIDIPAGASAVLPGCAENGCNPMVWTSTSGTTWTAAWGNNTAVPGSIPGTRLVVGAARVLLFDGDEATRLWYSTDAVTWDQVALPETMAALVVEGAVFGHGRFVAIFNNKYAGGPNAVYGESDTVWTSRNGMTWTPASVAGPPAAFESLTVMPTGFRITGLLRRNGDSAAWTSSDGITWALTARGSAIEPPEG